MQQSQSKPIDQSMPKNSPDDPNHQLDTDLVTVNFKALGAALFELSDINAFITDMSRVLQQENLMDNEKVVTQGFPHYAAAAIEHACRKESELYEVIEAAIGKEFKPYEYRPNISLFKMPSESTFYYGGYSHKGVLSGDQQANNTGVN